MLYEKFNIFTQKNAVPLAGFSSTSGIKHWGLSGYASVLPRIKFGVTGQDSSPQSPTFHTANRYAQFIKTAYELRKF